MLLLSIIARWESAVLNMDWLWIVKAYFIQHFLPAICLDLLQSDRCPPLKRVNDNVVFQLAVCAVFALAGTLPEIIIAGGRAVDIDHQHVNH